MELKEFNLQTRISTSRITGISQASFLLLSIDIQRKGTIIRKLFLLWRMLAYLILQYWIVTSKVATCSANAPSCILEPLKSSLPSCILRKITLGVPDGSTITLYDENLDLGGRIQEIQKSPPRKCGQCALEARKASLAK